MNFVQGTTTVECFKKDFYSKTKDLSLYDCGEINLLKVVLDGLKVNYVSKGKFRLPFFYSDFLWNIHQAIQRKKNKAGVPQKNLVVTVLVADLSGRNETQLNGVPESFYFSKLLRELKADEFVHVVEHFKAKNYPFHVDLRKFTALQYEPLNSKEKKLREDLLETFKKIEKSGSFDQAELRNIKIAIQSFFCQFKIWNELLKQFPSVKHAVLEQHYHHEGLLLALKQNNIRSIEIQHGLIAESDIFYVFPKEVAAIKEKALFPDKILVYGTYWKDVLSRGAEFNAEDIVVAGDFRQKNSTLTNTEEEISIKQFAGGSKIILISTQTFMHAFYGNYTQWLSQLLETTHKDWKILVKLHPNEKEENYAEINGLSNVFITKCNIMYLFGLSSIHISVFSTTLFDSLGYPPVNFSLKNDAFKDYIENIIKDKIALPLDIHEDPVLKSEKLPRSSMIDPHYVYSDFSPKIFKNLFLN